MTRSLILAVDRLEGRTAVLVDDAGHDIEVDHRKLPKGARREGAVVRVDVDDAGNPDWKTARVDPVEEKRRIDDARHRLDRLKRSDPGGDLSF